MLLRQIFAFIFIFLFGGSSPVEGLQKSGLFSDKELEAVRTLAKAHAAATAAFEGELLREQTYRQFIAQTYQATKAYDDSSGEWLSFIAGSRTVMDALARLQGLNMVIWQGEGSPAQPLKIVHEYIWDATKPMHNIRYDGNSAHFTILDGAEAVLATGELTHSTVDNSDQGQQTRIGVELIPGQAVAGFIDYGHEQHDRRGVMRATVSPSIDIRTKSDISSLNRDMTHRTEVTKDAHSKVWVGAPLLVDAAQAWHDMQGGLAVLGQGVEQFTDTVAATYHYLTDEQGLSPEQAMAEISDPEVQTVVKELSQLNDQLKAVEKRVVDQGEAKAKLTQQSSKQSVGKKVSAQAQQSGPAKTEQIAEIILPNMVFATLLPQEAQREVLASIRQERLALIEAHERSLQKRSNQGKLSTTAQLYYEAALDTLREAKEYITEHPVKFGAQAAEMLPLGIGTAFTVGNQGYEVYAGNKTTLQAGKDLAVDAAIGYVGYKAIKGLGKASKFLSTTFRTKLDHAIAKKAGKGVQTSKQLPNGKRPAEW